MMNKIIGNQDRERQSKVDTEKWKEHAEHYNALRNTKKKTETQIPIETQNLENKILTYDNKGKPKLELKAIEKTYINTQTLEEYDTLMQVYEAGGWKWAQGIELGDVDARNFMWKTYRENICLQTEKHFSYGTTKGIESTNSVVKNRIQIITPNEFYKTQNITPEMIIELNEWYDTHKPDRASK